jgi:hypothetical protein
MRQLSSSGLFGGGGFKGKMMRRMTGLPDMSGYTGNGDDLPGIPGLPTGPSRKKLKKKKKKRRR